MRSTIIVHFCLDAYDISDVNPIDYDLVKLTRDCCNVTLGIQVGDIGQNPILEGMIPWTNETFALENDVDVRTLFVMYENLGEKVVHVKLAFCESSFLFNESETGQTERNAQTEGIMNEQELKNEQFQWSNGDSVEGNNSQDGGLANSGDELSNYDSSDNEDFKGLTDEENEVGNSLSEMSKEMLSNYFKLNSEGNIEFAKDQTFDDVYHFRRVLKEYSIQEGFNLYRLHNEKSRVTVKCARSEDCTWRIHASPIGGDDITYKVKSYNDEHTCSPFDVQFKEATSDWIAKKLLSEFEIDPMTSVSKIGKKLAVEFGVHVKPNRLYNARRMAQNIVSGDHSGSYAKIPKYANILKERNPGIVVGFQCVGLDVTNPQCNPIFKRLFIGFPAQKEGFVNGCRPFIGIDGCFLKGTYKGQLLVAVALDANSGIFPLAFMFAETESEDSWGYFLECLETHLRDDRKLTFMTDKQKGILKAVKKVYPMASNRYCARHRYNNFRTIYPGPKFKLLYWRAVKASNLQKFNDAMRQIKQMNEKAYDWLMTDPPQNWSIHAFDEHVKNDHVTNNMTESFNSWLNEERQKPILTLMEYMRRRVMNRFVKRFEKCSKWTTEIPPRVRDRLNKNRKDGRHLQGCSNGHEYEIFDDRTYLLNLKDKTCQCGEWQISGVPCKHAMACITHKQGNPVNYLDHFLSKDAYLKTYCGRINTIPDESAWPEVDHPTIQPPLIQRKRGRPKLNRRREEGEAPALGKRTKILKCGYCKAPGHNIKTCSNNPANHFKTRRDKKRSAQASQITLPGGQFIEGASSYFAEHAIQASNASV